MRVVLASGSPRRKDLLTQVGIDFEIKVSNVEEIITGTHPKEVVESLSYQKAKDVFDGIESDVVVIGADTVVSVDDGILGKPKDTLDAINMIKSISGREHSVFTGVTLCIRGNGAEEVITFAEETVVCVACMRKADIEKYVATGEPMDKAGGYGIQGKFAAYIDGIHGDYNNVVGLPVGHICKIFREKGIIV